MAGLALAWPQAHADTTASAPAGQMLLDEFLARAQTLSAGFRQELLSADGQLLESAEGEFALERPSHFRWRYAVPFEQVIVADAQRLWMYDVELQQVTVAPLASPSVSSPAMLLSGDAAARDAFRVIEGFERDGVSWVRLEPTFEDTDFQVVSIGFTGGNLSNLEMTDGLNQITRIEFTDVRLNVPLPPDTFVFVPPPGASLIGAP